MQDGKYWVDDDGYIAHGKEDDYTIVSGCIKPLHVEPLTALIEAGTVANETGYTPRQLADHKADLLAACEARRDMFIKDWGVKLWEEHNKTFIAAIAKATT